jgi:hypothetical protein
MDIDKLLNSGFTPGPWRFDWAGWKGKPCAMHARIEGQEYGSRETIMVPSYKGIEVDNIWIGVSKANGALMESAPDLLHYAKALEDKLALLEEYIGYVDWADAESWIKRKESV